MNKKELQKIKEKALEDHIPILMDETLDAIKKYLKNKSIKSILEIGTAVGYSTICFSELIEENGKIDTIEIDEQRYSIAKENFKKAEVENKINVYLGNAVDILPTLNKKYDIIFIDAAKGKYPIFLREAIRLSKPGTIILADNILYKGYVLGNYNKHKQRTAVTHLREYLKEVQENENLQTEILEVGDGLAVSVVKK